MGEFCKKMSAFDYFEEIVCINLDRRTDRWELMQKEFDKINILDRVRRFSAVENVDGQKGCFESHIQCILNARKNKLKNILIFEDDVVFLPHYDERKIKNSIDILKDNYWEFYYLGGLERRIKPRKKYNYLKNNFKGDFDEKHSYTMKANSVGWAQSYAVNNTIYDKIYEDYHDGLWDVLTKKFGKRTGGADKYYQFVLCPQTFASVPSLTSQYDITSDLSPTHTNTRLRISLYKNK
jgi:hypothetical protein